MTALLSPPAQSEAIDADAALRLRLNPLLDRKGTVDGAWWPRSRDASAELPALIAALDQRLGRTVLRVGLYRNAWDRIPRRIPAPGRQVKVGWFLSSDPHLVTLTIAGTPHLTLLVIPPGAPTTPAGAALALAASGTVGVGPADILDPTGAYRNKAGLAISSWENEGGRLRAG